jgi:hypothetical protein
MVMRDMFSSSTIRGGKALFRRGSRPKEKRASDEKKKKKNFCVLTVFDKIKIGFRSGLFHGPVYRSGGMYGQCMHSAPAVEWWPSPKRETFWKTCRYSSTIASSFSVGEDGGTSLHATASTSSSFQSVGPRSTYESIGAASPASAAARPRATSGQRRGRKSPEKM